MAMAGYNPEEAIKVQERMAEKGTKCYRTSSGYFYCEDTK